MTAVPPRLTTPDVSTDTGALREAVARDLAPAHWPILLERHRDRLRNKADAFLSLPVIRALIARRDQAIATVMRVEELAKEWERNGGELNDPLQQVRRALDGAA